MYRTVTLLYCVCFAVYILFSRQPDYFESELTPATIMEAKLLEPAVLKMHNIAPEDFPVARYNVGSETFYYNGAGNSLQRWSKPAGSVNVIYNPGQPQKAEIYQFWGYWIVMKELVFSMVGFVALFGVAIVISYKSSANDYKEPDLERQMKYN